MAIADMNTNMQGIGTNPGLLLKAADFCAQGTEVVSGSYFLGGKAVRGTVQGQILMETGWLPSGTLNNIVLPTAYITGDNAATDAISYFDNIIVTVYKRLSSTNITDEIYIPPATIIDGGVPTELVVSSYTQSEAAIETQEFTIHYIDGISDTIGAIPNAMQVNRPATNFLWFDTRYEYKFSVRIGRMTGGAYIDLAGIYLQFHTSTAVMGARQFNWSGLSTESVPIIDGLQWGVTADASGNFTVVLGSESLDGAGGIGGATGIQGGLFNSIESTLTSLESASVYDNSYVIYTYPQVSTTNGGYEVVVIGLNFGANSILTFSTLIYGHQTAQEM